MKNLLAKMLKILVVFFVLLNFSQTNASAVGQPCGQGLPACPSGEFCINISSVTKVGSCDVVGGKKVGLFNLGNYLFLGKTGDSVITNYYDPASLINTIVTNLFVIGGVILMLMVFYAGFKFITQGQKGAEEAKTILTTAVIGFIIMLSAYWIVQIVEIITGVTIIL